MMSPNHRLGAALKAAVAPNLSARVLAALTTGGGGYAPKHDMTALSADSVAGAAAPPALHYDPGGSGVRLRL